MCKNNQEDQLNKHLSLNQPWGSEDWPKTYSFLRLNVKCGYAGVNENLWEPVKSASAGKHGQV